MNLEIVSPEKIIYSGEAEVVTLPGIKGSFTVLNRHAPIVSILKKGRLRYLINGKNEVMIINEGFVEVNNNTISVCIE